MPKKTQSPSRFEFNVAGVTFEGRQHALAKIDSRLRVRAPRSLTFPRLVRERDNAFDPNAIKVLVYVSDDNGRTYSWWPVGYVPKEIAATLAPKLDAHELRADEGQLKIIGGYAGKSYGCVCAFDLKRPRTSTANVS